MSKKRTIDLTYCEFDLSKIHDSKGGYFLPPKPAEKAAKVKNDELAKYGKCESCSESALVDANIFKYYKVLVCSGCKSKEEYSLLTKTEARQDYLLTDSELKSLPFWMKANPLQASYSNMLLYLRKQVEAFAKEKHGSLEEMDKEFGRRMEVSTQRKEAKLSKKIIELRKKTRTSLSVARSSLKDHAHIYGEPEEKGDLMVLTCTICAIKVEYEEL